MRLFLKSLSLVVLCVCLAVPGRGAGGTLWVFGEDAALLGDAPAGGRVSGVKMVSGGTHVTTYITDDGALWVVGGDAAGSGFIGITQADGQPVKIDPSGVVSVAAGGGHCLWVKTDGSLWGIGQNLSGQLGDGSIVSKFMPVQIFAGGVAAISAGGEHSLVLKADGSLWAAGNNEYGQLGDGTTLNQKSFVKVVDSGVTAISAGGSTSHFVKVDGSMWGMGFNAHGEVGNGDTAAVSAPVQIESSGVVSVCQGGAHFVYLKSDGSAWGAGYNALGAVGNLGGQICLTPVSILSTGVKSIGAGMHHSMFLKTDHSLWGLGWDYYSQLGDGLRSGQFVPKVVRVGVESVACGRTHTLVVGANVEAPSAPHFTSIPANRTANAGDSITLSVAASGAPAPTFKWYLNWQVLDGQSGPDLVIQSASPANEGTYYVMASNPVGSDTSGYFTLSGISRPAAITTQPESVSAGIGDAVSFSIGASGLPTPTVQWYFNNVAIDGATQSTLAVPSAQLSNVGNYYAIVSNTLATVKSNVVGLSGSDPAPAISSQPGDAIVRGGQSVTLHVGASGAHALTYQWRRNGVAILGATASDLTINSFAAENAGNYDVVVASSLSTTKSDIAKLVLEQTSISPASREVGGEALSFYVQVTSNTSWTAASNVPWMTLSTTSGVLAGGILVNASANNSGADRGATLTVNGVTLAVTQHALGVNLSEAWVFGSFTSMNASGADILSRILPETQIFTDAKSISTGGAGLGFCLIVKADGSLWSMGYNSYGQLGDGTQTDRSVPVQILSSGVNSIATGSSHAMILKVDGSLWTMGSNGSGQLGDGTNSTRLVPTQILSSGVKAIAAGADYSMFVKTDGSLWAMGSNIYGQLGDGSTLNRTSPVRIVSNGVQTVAAGNMETMFVKTDGSLWGMGYNSNGQLGDGTTTNRLVPVQALAGGVKAVSVNGMSTLILKSDGSLWGLGYNGYGQFANANVSWFTTPGVIFDGGVHAMSLGNGYSLILKDDGSLWSAGLNSYGQLGFSGAGTQGVPVLVAANVQSISAGDVLSAIVTNGSPHPEAPQITMLPVDLTSTLGGTVTFSVVATGAPSPTYQWFHNGYAIAGATDPNLIVSNCQLRDAGTYYVVIRNAAGSTASNPVVLSGGGAAPSITEQPVGAIVIAGDPVTLRVTASGSGALAYQWRHDGVPITGATGSTYSIASFTPDLVGAYDVLVGSGLSATLSDAVQLTLDTTALSPATHTVGCGSVGYPVRVTSNADWYALSDADWVSVSPTYGSQNDVLIVTTVANTTGIERSATVYVNGATHVVSQKPAGVPLNELWVFGSDVFGQLGDSGSLPRLSPLQIASDVAEVAAGDGFSLFSKSDGSLWSIGNNGYGQLGDGSNQNHSQSIQVMSGGVMLLDAGSSHSLILKSDGSVWGMGSSAYGQLLAATSLNSPSLCIPGGVTAIAASDYSSYFVKTDGSLWDCGNNGYGGLGDGTIDSRATAYRVFSSGVKRIAAGASHALIVKTDGSLWAMGLNDYGQLGDGTTIDRHTPVRILPSGVDSVSGAFGTSFIVKTDGSLWAMGFNGSGQYGDGTTTDRLVPTKIASSNVKAVAAGMFHTLVLKTDGSLWTSGFNDMGQLGDGSTTGRSTLKLLAVNVVRIAAGSSHSLFVANGDIVPAAPSITAQPQNQTVALGGAVTFSVSATGNPTPSFQWYANGYAIAGATSSSLTLNNVQISDGGKYHVVVSNLIESVTSDEVTLSGSAPAPVIVRQTSDTVVRVGQSTTLSVTATGSGTLTYQWRRNGIAIDGATGSTYALSAFTNDQAGLYDVRVADGLTVVYSTPAKVALDSTAVTPASRIIGAGNTRYPISITSNSSWVLTSDADWLVPSTSNGSLDAVLVLTAAPNVTGADRTAILQANDGLHTVTQRAASAALPEAWAWGVADHGQLGDYGATTRSNPVEVMSDVKMVAAGFSHSLWLKTDGSLWASGDNSNGQFGDGTTISHASPVMIQPSGVRSIAASYNVTYFIKTDGSLWATGSGVGPSGTALVPIQVMSSGVSAVSTGWGHSLVLKSDGSLWAVGDNNSGQFGDGTTTSSTVPVRIFANGIKAVACGGAHSLIVKTDGSLWAMGYNAYGQLGDGTTTDRKAPVKILASGVQNVAVGRNHSFFIKTDGSLWAMGDYGSGQLGAADTSNYTRPTQVMSDVQAVATFQNYSLFLKTDGSVWLAGAHYFGQVDDGLIAYRFTPKLVAANVLQVAAGYGHSLFVAIGDIAPHLPVVTQQPVSQQVSVGDSVTFTTAVTGAPAPTFQWYRNGVALAGATGATLTLTNVQQTDAGSYHVVATNAVGSTSSNDAILSGSGAAPVIVSQPLDAVVRSGASTTLSVSTSTTAGLTYQWRFNGVAITGANGDSYTISNFNAGGEGSYDVLVYNGLSSTLSWTVHLTLEHTSLTPTSHEVGAGTVPYQILVTSNASWVATSDSPWVTFGRDNGVQTANLTMIAAPNTTGLDRVATIQVNGVPFTLTQRAAIPALAEAWSTGSGAMGELGDNPAGSGELRSLPIQFDTRVASVSGGAFFSLIVKTDGSLWGTGNNRNGQLGDGTTSSRIAPVQILAGGVKAVAAGGYHSLILKTDGSLWGTGYNGAGELGDGTLIQRSVPVQILAGGVKAIAAGKFHSMVLKTDGSLWMMGSNDRGQLGDGTNTNQNLPVKVLASGVQAIAAGGYHSLVLRNDGSLFAMGSNTWGQLGDGTRADRNSRVQIFANGVLGIGAGVDSSYIIRTDGSLWATGYNGDAQFEDTTYSDLNTPVQLVAGGVLSVSAGHLHCVFMKAGGSLWALGRNNSGQLGTQDSVNYLTPVHIASNVLDASAGYYHSLIVATGAIAPVPDATPTPTPTPSRTPTPSPTPRPTSTPTPSPTPTPTPSATPTATPVPTVIVVATPTPTSTPLPTVTPSPTATPTPSRTPTPSSTPTPTPTPSRTPTPTVTPSATPTPTPSSTPTPTPSATTTPTPSPSITPTPSPSPTVTPTPSSTPTPRPTVSPTPAPGPVIDSSPSSQVVTEGDPVSFVASAHGAGTLAAQWYKNGVMIDGASSLTYALAHAAKSDIAGYTLLVSNAYGAVQTSPAFLSVLAPSTAPVIVTPPQSVTGVAGSTVTFSVETLNAPAPAGVAAVPASLVYQWFHDAAPIAGATGSNLTLVGIIESDTGSYTVTLSNGTASVTSRPARLTVAAPAPGRIINLSVRSVAGNNGASLIVGFVSQGGSKSYLIRGAGPSLLAFPGVSGVLLDPALDLHGDVGAGDVLLSTNDNWGDGGLSAALSAVFQRVGAFDFAGAESKDAALLVDVDGPRTVHVRSASGAGSGMVLAETYDAGTGLSPRLINVSARNYAGSGADTLIAGFVLDGNEPKKVLIRGVGPGLGQFGLKDFMKNPLVYLYRSASDGTSVLQATNDTWTDEPGALEAIVHSGAFRLPADSADAAIVYTAPAGAYTAVVTAPSGDTGEALVEVYEVP